MLTRELVLVVPGWPAPKGSLRNIGPRGAPHRLIEDNPRTKQWRALVAAAAWTRQAWPVERIDPGQPVGVEATFTLPRPASHYRAGRYSDLLKPGAPTHPVSHRTGDLDKLLRAILDALQDTPLLPDDSQVIDVQTRKAYPLNDADYSTPQARAELTDVLPQPGVVIRIYPL